MRSSETAVKKRSSEKSSYRTDIVEKPFNSQKENQQQQLTKPEALQDCPSAPCSHETSRRNSQVKVELPLSSQELRKKRPVPQLNLALKSPKNIVESITERTENYLARNLKLAATTTACNTYRDSVPNALKQRITETNKNKKSDLDLVISKMHDEQKHPKGSQTTREITIDKTQPLQIVTLDDTASNARQLVGSNLVSPSNLEVTKSFSLQSLLTGQKFEYSIQKLCVKPGSRGVPKKELSETSLKCSEEPSQLTEIVQQVHSPEEQRAMLQGIARDEKTEIKSLMLAQYGTESSYHKGNLLRTLLCI